MSARRIDADCVILGGGAVGTLAGMLAAETGYRCVVIRLPDHPKPEAETLRNQAWLQSGALFSRLKGEGVPSALSLKLRLQGQRLLTEMNLAPATARGLARFPEDRVDEVETFIKDAQELRIGAQVRRLELKVARARVGALHRKGTTYIEVPDAPFDEAGMLVTARARALAAGVRFVEVPSPVHIEPGGETHTWHLIIEGERFTAPRLLLAAGIGNLDLLDALGVEHDLIVKRTPLLVIPRTEGMEVPILIDRSQKLAVACYSRKLRPPHGCLVAGVYVGAEVSKEQLEGRAIPKRDWNEIYRILPKQLQGRRGDGHRFTCGYEVMRTGAKRIRKEDLLVEAIKAYEGIVLALPGRATLAYRAAEKAIDLLNLGRDRDAKHPVTEFDLGDEWAGPIYMHHETNYDRLDDRAKESP